MQHMNDIYATIIHFTSLHLNSSIFLTTEGEKKTTYPTSCFLHFASCATATVLGCSAARGATRL